MLLKCYYFPFNNVCHRGRNSSVYHLPPDSNPYPIMLFAQPKGFLEKGQPCMGRSYISTSYQNLALVNNATECSWASGASKNFVLREDLSFVLNTYNNTCIIRVCV